jgi:hypothetical protein
MSPNYGDNEAPGGVLVADWLLGGNRKRRVLAALSEPEAVGAWRPAELAGSLGCGRTTVFEIVRALRAFGVLREEPAGVVRIDPGSEVGQALIALVQRIEGLADQPLDRPPRERDRGESAPALPHK